MASYHPLVELAPRDVVARAIVSEMEGTGADPHVYLDLTHAVQSLIRERFPRIYDTCLKYGVDIATDRSRPPRRTLRHGRRATRSRWTHERGASLRGGRSRVHGSTWRQSTRQQLASGGVGIRRARSPCHAS